MRDLAQNEIDELLGALREAPRDDDGEAGMTGPEIAKLWGCSLQVTRARLASAIASGRVRQVRVRRMRLGDVMQRVPGYRIAS